MQNNEQIVENLQEEDVQQFDYENSGWPRDFDIRIEVAEQREVLEQSIR